MQVLTSPTVKSIKADGRMSAKISKCMYDRTGLIENIFSEVRTTIDPIKDFALDLGPVTAEGKEPTSLVECLEKFTRAEHLASTLMCSNCEAYQASTKQLTLKTLPIVVSFQLKRFSPHKGV